MKLLVIGGTRFVGRHFVVAALARGHELTLFNRGKHSPTLLPGVEVIHGDRFSDLHKLAGRRWDAAIDTCAFLPRAVRASAEALGDAVDAYIFISSQSVYADVSHPGVNETSSTETLTSEQFEKANAIDPAQASAAAYGDIAIEAGLTLRSLTDTIADTLNWHTTTSTNEVLKAGLDAQKEQRLLRQWQTALTEA